jgi:hypothetical protein
MFPYDPEKMDETFNISLFNKSNQICHNKIKNGEWCNDSFNLIAF